MKTEKQVVENANIMARKFAAAFGFDAGALVIVDEIVCLFDFVVAFGTVDSKMSRSCCICFLVVVVNAGSTELPVALSKASVKSWAAAMICPSLVAVGIRKL